MCRYAMSGPYKSHYVCFACRKAFKQPPIDDYLEVRGRGFVYRQLRHLWANKEALALRENELGHRLSDLEEEYRNASHVCPECRQPMIDMGLDFKPPQHSDVKAWNTLRGMYRAGHAFHTCGCDGPGWIPTSTSDYRSYLDSRKQHYEEQLERVQNSSDLSAAARQEALEYWGDRIEAIAREQAVVS